MYFKKLLPRFDNSTGSGGLDLGTSNDVANKGISTGENAINSFNPTQTAGAQQTNTSKLFNIQQGQTKDYTQQYMDAIKNNPTVQALYQTGNQLYNVGPLARQATDLSSRVTNAVPAAYRAAKGYDIDSTDINNGIAASEAYLTPQSNAATANYNTAAGLSANYVNAGISQNATNLQPIQAAGTQLLQQQAAQATGWNQAAQMEFQGLIDKMNAGVTLSGNELNRANTLAQVMEAYQQQLTVNSTAIQNANTAANASMNVARLNNQFQNVPYTNRLINTMSGNITA